jgi:diphthamide synthase (EF-2-diphthine--ammonia ligase)
MQRVRRSLLEAQATAAGIPLWPVELPSPCPDAVYAERMGAAMERGRSEGITHVAFGDLFLDDIRAYREGMMEGTGVEPLFPIWCGEEGTAALAQEMIDAGLEATVTCVDTDQLPAEFVGRRFDTDLLRDLPRGVDPLGERGEFHTFCHAGPMLSTRLEVEVGPLSDEGRFVWVDLDLRRQAALR